jgi:hypothetical protein
MKRSRQQKKNIIYLTSLLIGLLLLNIAIAPSFKTFFDMSFLGTTIQVITNIVLLVAIFYFIGHKFNVGYRLRSHTNTTIRKEIIKTISDTLIGSLTVFGLIHWGVEPLSNNLELIIFFSVFVIALLCLWVYPEPKSVGLSWHLIINVSVLGVVTFAFCWASGKFQGSEYFPIVLVLWGIMIPIVIAIDKILN